MNSDAVRSLKQIITELHSDPNADRDELTKRFAKVASQVSSVEIAQAEQEAIQEGVSPESIRKLCDVHLDMFVDDARERRTKLAPGHPISIMYDEHDTLLAALRSARTVLLPSDGTTPSAAAAVQAITTAMPILDGAERNFVKQENAFFPVVEKHGVTQPPAIMWSEHDTLRELFKTLSSMEPGDLTRAGQLLLQAEETMAAHVHKEETVLFDMALKIFSDEEWSAIRRDFDDLGYLHDTVAEYEGAGKSASPGESSDAGAVISTTGRIAMPSGSLDVDQLVAMLNTLPVDITFVDAEDKVAYFSESSERIFPRARSVVGRSVQNCHPPKSVHIVQEILDSFRAGTRESEEFYLHLGDRYIYIRYFAMRDEAGVYTGCLEVSQDIGPIQKITGEKRIV